MKFIKDLLHSKVEKIKSNIAVGTTNSINRDKWVEKTLKTIPAGLKILDVGAGEQQYKKYCSHLKYVSQDFCQYNGKTDNIGLHTQKWDVSNIDIVSDITNIPEKDKSFDVILCTEVFEHLPDPISAIKEFSRLLKKDGYLIITAPFCSATHFSPYHYYSGFNRSFYNEHLIEYGFEILEINTNGNFFEYLAQELRRLPYMVESYTGEKTNLWHKLLIWLMLPSLNRFSKLDKKSHEFLTFGYHILAKKII